MTAVPEEITKERVLALVADFYDQFQRMKAGSLTPAGLRFQLKVMRLLKGMITAYEEWLINS